MKIIGKRLRALRTARGLTQQGLAAKVSGNLDYTYIGKIERGEQLPSLKVLTKLGAALGVPLGDFFREEESTDLTSAAALAALPGGEEGRDLLRALQRLHPDDVPLAVALVKALNRHRQTRRPALPGADDFQRAAEGEEPYGGK